MLKLAIMAKEGISIDILLDDPPDKVTLPPEPIYEDDVENSTAQSERIDVPEMNSSKIRGSIVVKKKNLLAYCVEKNLGNIVIAKQSL